MLIESASIPLPSEIIMGISGYLVYKGEMNLFLAGLAGAIGNIMGSTIMYYLGSKGGRPAIEKYGRYIHFDEQKFAKVDKWFSKWGDIVVFAAQLMPVVRTFISFPAGVLRIHYPKFIFYTFTGALIWCTALAYIASLLGPEWEKLSSATKEAEGIAVIVVALLFGFYLLRRIYKSRSQD